MKTNQSNTPEEAFKLLFENPDGYVGIGRTVVSR